MSHKFFFQSISIMVVGTRNANRHAGSASKKNKSTPTNKNKDPYCKTFVNKHSAAIAAPKTIKLLKKAPPKDIEVKEENILPMTHLVSPLSANGEKAADFSGLSVPPRKLELDLDEGLNKNIEVSKVTRSAVKGTTADGLTKEKKKATTNQHKPLVNKTLAEKDASGDDRKDGGDDETYKQWKQENAAMLQKVMKEHAVKRKVPTFANADTTDDGSDNSSIEEVIAPPKGTMKEVPKKRNVPKKHKGPSSLDSLDDFDTDDGMNGHLNVPAKHERKRSFDSMQDFIVGDDDIDEAVLSDHTDNVSLAENNEPTTDKRKKKSYATKQDKPPSNKKAKTNKSQNSGTINGNRETFVLSEAEEESDAEGAPIMIPRTASTITEKGKKNPYLKSKKTPGDNRDEDSDGDVSLPGSSNNSNDNKTLDANKKTNSRFKPFKLILDAAPEQKNSLHMKQTNERGNRVFVYNTASNDIVAHAMNPRKQRMPASDKYWRKFLSDSKERKEKCMKLYNFHDVVNLRDPKDPDKNLDGNQEGNQAGMPWFGLIRYKRTSTSEDKLLHFGRKIAGFFTKAGKGPVYANNYTFVANLTPPGPLLPLSYFVTTTDVLWALGQKHKGKTFRELLNDDSITPLYFDKRALLAAKKIVFNDNFVQPGDSDDEDDEEATFWNNQRRQYN